MRKTLPLVILTCALALASTPAVEAQSTEEYGWAYLFAGQAALLSVEAGPNAVVFTLHDVTIDGDLASDARTAIDLFDAVGDGDGELTESEVVGAEALMQSTINSMLPQQFDFQMITIDGETAFADGRSAVEMMALDIKGAAGPVTSTEPIQTDVKVRLRFDSVDQDATTHLVRFENLYGDLSGTAPNELPPARIEVTGYRSWQIESASIAPAAFQDRLADDTMSFENADIAYFDEEGEGLEFTIQGDPDDRIGDSEDSPAATPLVLVGLLGAALVALRRRR